MEQGVYRIADEVFSNISRHAHGATRLEVILCQENGHLDLLIADDGPGFDPAATLSGGHYGLKGLHERAAMMGGILNVEAEPGSGTRVTLRLGLEGIDG
jgi:signal transduction histidine kinase